MDALPTTFNTFQADADASAQRVAEAVLPTLFTPPTRKAVRSATRTTCCPPR
ncbi:hypothetical protein GCM10020000_28820 [Streptomyces olivoverticillatus]